jgi:RHS repeat-associated protein
MDGDIYNFEYNGLGNRLNQTVNGVPTDYTLDINQGLTQVLEDGTNRYLYGLQRIGEVQAEGSIYHLEDVIKSVRQLVTNDDEVIEGSAYKPFGTRLENGTIVQTNYGYTGEWTDQSELIYLRARLYSTEVGRFISKDIWDGEPTEPMSYNPWLYTYNNPVLWRDPSGIRVATPCEEFGIESHDCKEQILSNWTDEKQSPPFIIWSPYVGIRPAVILDAGRRVNPGVNGAQKYACDGCLSACGVVALAAIRRLDDPNLSANDLFKKAQNTQNVLNPAGGLSAFELQSLARSLPGWTATTYKSYPDWNTRNGFAIFEDLSGNRGEKRLRDELSLGNYPIPGVRISGSFYAEVGGRIGAGGAKAAYHWVDVSGLSADYQWRKGSMWRWVRIYNPFDNQVEYYRWDVFYDNWYLYPPNLREVVVIER